jgi:hypothetical protein
MLELYFEKNNNIEEIIIDDYIIYIGYKCFIFENSKVSKFLEKDSHKYFIIIDYIDKNIINKLINLIINDLEKSEIFKLKCEELILGEL